MQSERDAERSTIMMCKLLSHLTNNVPSVTFFFCNTNYFLYYFSNVGTIENFQGVEQEVIILSLTRSNPAFVENDVKRRMGIFGMPKQANVALTRAENLFIVIGNPAAMWKDSLWRQWVSNLFHRQQ